VWDTQRGDCVSTLKGHTDAINGLAFSPDGKSLATASSDRTVKVWDVATAQGARTFTLPYSNVSALNPDGTRLARREEGQIRLWDTTTGQEDQAFPVSGRILWSLVYSGDGSRLAVAGDDQKVKVWNTQTRQEERTLEIPTPFSTQVALSHNGARLAAATYSGPVTFWDTVTGVQMLTVGGDRGKVYKAAFSPDDKLLVGAWRRHEGPTVVGVGVTVWDATSGQETVRLTEAGVEVFDFAFSPDGRHLAVAFGDGTVTVWDPTTGRQTLALKGHSNTVSKVAFSPGGRRLVSTAVDRTVKVWETETGQEVLSLEGGEGVYPGVGFSQDGRRLVYAGNKELKVWDAPAASPSSAFHSARPVQR
jgi:WD40 repeat protein